MCASRHPPAGACARAKQSAASCSASRVLPAPPAPVRVRSRVSPNAVRSAYGFLLTAVAHGRVSVVSPLNATGSLWAVALAALTFRRTEQIGGYTLAAAILIVIGGVTIGAGG